MPPVEEGGRKERVVIKERTRPNVPLAVSPGGAQHWLGAQPEACHSSALLRPANSVRPRMVLNQNLGGMKGSRNSTAIKLLDLSGR